MPAAAAAALISGIAAGSSIAAGLGFSWAAFGASLAISALSRALIKKPQQADSGFAGRTVTLRQPAAPRQVIYGRARVGGTIAWMHARDQLGGDQYLHISVVLAGHECDAIEEVWFDDYRLDLDADGWERGRYNPGGTPTGYVLVRKYLGAPGQAADAQFLALSDGKWTADHRLTGCTHLAILLAANPDLFPNGIPAISAVVRGRKVYDPRTGATAWSANSAVCARDYLVNYVGVPEASIVGADAIASANVCDERVPLADGSTEPRYETNGAFTLDRSPADMLPQLANAMAGTIVRSGGTWTIEAGAYTAPSIVLTDDDLRAPERVRTRISRREGFNSIRGTFVSPSTNWQPDDFPPVQSSVFIAEDSGTQVWKDIELPFTTSAAMAQRLAKIDLLRARQQITVELPCKLNALRLRPGSVIGYTSSFYGWTAKPFRVVGFSLQSEDLDGVPRLGVNLQLREVAADVYDWGTSEEAAYDPAPNTNLPNPFSIAPPGVPAIAEDLVDVYGDVVARAVITFAASPSAFANAYQVEYQPVGAGYWVVLPPSDALRHEVVNIAAGLYDFRAKAISQRGVSSAYATTRVEITGLSGRPAAITGLTLQAVSSLAVLQWTQSTDLDVQRRGRILVRHSEAMTGATWEDSYSVAEALPGNATIAVVPLKGGTYLVKAEDSSGQQSETAATINTKAASVLTFSSLASVTEDPSFSGTKTGCVLDGSVLKLSGSGQWDTIADVDALANVDAFGGFSGAGTYEFAAGIDLGSVKRVQLTTTLAVQTVQAVSLWDSRSEPIDSWLDLDGPAAGGVGDVVIEVRETDDNPAGTPTWSAWRRLVTADYVARAFQFRAQLSVSDPAYNIQISQLRVAASEVV